MSKIVDFKNGYNISRKNMPQIAVEDIPEFLRFLQDKKVSFKQVKEKVSALKPTQKHLNAEKVKNMVKQNDPDLLCQHFIVSKGNRLLDGHHRWAANRVMDNEANVNVIRVNLPMNKLIELGHDFDLSYTKGIKEVIKLSPIMKEIIK